MKTKDIIFTVVIVLVLLSVAFCFGVKKGNKTNVRPLESYLIQEVTDPNWIINYGVDLESRLVYNVAMLNRVVNSQGTAIRQLLEREPNQ